MRTRDHARSHAFRFFLLTALIIAAPGAARVCAQSSAATPQEKQATVFGAKLRYQEAGAGPVVILLHGLGGDSSNWASTIGPLSQKYRVIVPDQIGFGKSDRPPLTKSRFIGRSMSWEGRCRD